MWASKVYGFQLSFNTPPRRGAATVQGILWGRPKGPKTPTLPLPNPTAQASTHTISSPAPHLVIRKAPHPTLRPLPGVWIGFLTPYVELMRSHSQEEPSTFLVLCPPPPTPLESSFMLYF